MILLIVLFAVLMGLSLLGGSNSIEEYCSLECQERWMKKYNFCC